MNLSDILSNNRPAETIRAVYAAIRAHDDPALFITLRPEAEALALADALADKDRASLPLYGVPFAVKDNIDVAGLPTTCACPDFAYRPQNSAFAVARLEAAGAIVIGKTNLDQFATGLVGVRSPYGTPRNAVRADLVPGGSSSGSASAVGAGLVPFALGTDTAGSGRVPAALQDIVGLKPSLGLISAGGVTPACRTLDTVSIFARSTADAWRVLEVAAGYDPAEAYSRPLPMGAPGAWPPRLKIAVPRPQDRIFLGDGHAERAFAQALEDLARRGATLVEIDMAPLFETARLLYDGPWVAERYAAIQEFIEQRPEALHEVTRAIIQSAKKFDAAATFKAQYRLQALRRRSAELFAGFDALATPTAPTLYTLADLAREPVLYNSNLGIYTNFVNLLDLCALAVRGPRRGDGLPSGLTLIAQSGRDAFLDGLGMALEGAPATAPAVAPAGTMPIAVVGAHLSGMPLNGQLTALGAAFLRADETAHDYRLLRLAGGPPLRPGLLKVAPGTGVAVKLEVWALPLAQVGAFLAQIPPPLGLGTVTLADGAMVKGFICEADGARGALDISAHGGWRAYAASL